MNAELKELLTPSELAESIKRGWEAYIVQEEGQLPMKRPYTYAGSYEECTRKLAYYLTDGDKLEPFPPEVLAKFHRGNDRERNLKIDLARVGQLCRPKFEVIGCCCSI